MPFLARGFSVTACDFSTAMLAEAARRAPEARARARRYPRAARSGPVRPGHLLRRRAQLPAPRRRAPGRRSRAMERSLAPGGVADLRPELAARLPDHLRRGQRARGRRPRVRLARTRLRGRAAGLRGRRRAGRVRAGRGGAVVPRARDRTASATSPASAWRHCSRGRASSACPCAACSRTARSRSRPTRPSIRRSSTPPGTREEVTRSEDHEDRAGPSGPVHHEARLTYTAAPARRGAGPGSPPARSPWRDRASSAPRSWSGVAATCTCSAPPRSRTCASSSPMRWRAGSSRRWTAPAPRWSSSASSAPSGWARRSRCSRTRSCSTTPPTTRACRSHARARTTASSATSARWAPRRSRRRSTSAGCARRVS